MDIYLILIQIKHKCDAYRIYVTNITIHLFFVFFITVVADRKSSAVESVHLGMYNLLENAFIFLHFFK